MIVNILGKMHPLQTQKRLHLMPTAPRGDDHRSCTVKLTALQWSVSIPSYTRILRLPIHEPMQLNSIVRACHHSHTILLQLKNAREDNMALSSALVKSRSSSLERGLWLPAHTPTALLHRIPNSGTRSIKHTMVWCALQGLDSLNTKG